MRNPNRITPVLGAIETYWRQHPDLRLGQLLWALAGKDPFHVEDDFFEGEARERAAKNDEPQEETAEILRDKSFMEDVQEGIEQLTRGDTLSWQQVKKELDL